MPTELLIRPTPGKPGLYRAYLGNDLIVTSKQPFFDGARALLRLGYPPDLLITMRHEGSAHPSFVPMPLSEASGLTVVENARKGPVITRYEPYPLKEERRAEKLTARNSPSERQGGTVQPGQAGLAASVR